MSPVYLLSQTSELADTCVGIFSYFKYNKYDLPGVHPEFLMHNIKIPNQI